jgi:hypothetical protein
MPNYTTGPNDAATQRALPDSEATLNVVQALIDAHMVTVFARPKFEISLPVGVAMPMKVRPVALREALLAGEPI